MKFYLVDDDTTVIKMLSNLIDDYQLGRVIGHNTDPVSALNEIEQLVPDICLVDMLMPEMNGNAFINIVKEKFSTISFIMISQVSAGEMIAEAYEKGASFYLHKPINAIEFKSVIHSVSEKITMQRTLESIKGVLGETIMISDNESKSIKNKSKKIHKILGELGILGEKGTYDLMELCEGLLEQSHWNEETINQVIRTYNDNPKIVKQRMRRAIAKGLTNIAHSGIEDYMNDQFAKYAHTLFDFQSVKEEMDYSRKKRSKGGKVSLTRFIEALLLMSQE